MFFHKIPFAGKEREYEGQITPPPSTRFSYLDAQTGARPIAYPSPTMRTCSTAGDADCAFQCGEGRRATIVAGDRPQAPKYVFRDMDDTIKETERFLRHGQAHISTPLDGTIGGMSHARDGFSSLVTAGNLPVSFGQPQAPSLRLLSGQTSANRATALTNIDTAAGYGLSPAFPRG